MSWEEASAHLEALGVDAMKSMAPSLHRMEAIVEALNHPESHVQAIHIAGTNGKSSTARIASSLLRASGLTVGTFTSPHLSSVNERIALDGEPLSRDAFGEVWDHISPFIDLVEDRLGESLTYFEILTAMFYLWAAESVDVAVVETGLGGLWDATNVLPESVAVLTNIALDHTALLGSDPVQIASEKAGIVKADTDVVIGERVPTIVARFEQAAEEVSARTSLIGRDFDIEDNRVAYGGRYLSLHTSRRSYEGLFLALHGRHQGVNAAVALEAVTRFLPSTDLDADLVADGFATVRAPGRMEVIPSAPAPFILDVAHNPDGMSAFVSSLEEAFTWGRLPVISGFLSDKDWRGMLTELARVSTTLLLVAPDSPRAAPIDEVAAVASELGFAVETFNDLDSATERSRDVAREGDLIAVTGSHYLVGGVRDAIGVGAKAETASEGLDV